MPVIGPRLSRNCLQFPGVRVTLTSVRHKWKNATCLKALELDWFWQDQGRLFGVEMLYVSELAGILRLWLSKEMKSSHMLDLLLVDWLQMSYPQILDSFYIFLVLVVKICSNVTICAVNNGVRVSVSVSVPYAFAFTWNEKLQFSSVIM